MEAICDCVKEAHRAEVILTGTSQLRQPRSSKSAGFFFPREIDDGVGSPGASYRTPPELDFQFALCIIVIGRLVGNKGGCGRILS